MPFFGSCRIYYRFIFTEVTGREAFLDTEVRPVYGCRRTALFSQLASGGQRVRRSNKGCIPFRSSNGQDADGLLASKQAFYLSLFQLDALQ